MTDGNTRDLAPSYRIAARLLVVAVVTYAIVETLGFLDMGSRFSSCPASE